MIFLSQRDARWANKTMVPTLLTLGRYGCTTTCLAMLTDYFGSFQRPDSIASFGLKYNLQAQIIWGTISLASMAFQERVFGFNQLKVDISLRDPNKAVILQVANGSHWVVALRKVPFSNQYFIADPWDGKLKMSGVYGNITGSAHFLRK